MKPSESEEQRRARLALEAKAIEIGKQIDSALPSGTGFAVVLFDFGDEGNFAYMSNARREDMVRLLMEWAEKLS